MLQAILLDAGGLLIKGSEGLRGLTDFLCGKEYFRDKLNPTRCAYILYLRNAFNRDLRGAGWYGRDST